jgi:hypothetical protein
MFPEHRLLQEELNGLNRVAVKEMCVIIITKVVWIGQTIETHFTGVLRDDAHCIGLFVQPIE